MRELRGANDALRDLAARDVGKSRDVLAHRAGKQLDVLWQVTDVLAKCIAIPARDVRSVETYCARLRSPQAEHESNEALSCPTRWAR